MYDPLSSVNPLFILPHNIIKNIFKDSKKLSLVSLLPSLPDTNPMVATALCVTRNMSKTLINVNPATKKAGLAPPIIFTVNPAQCDPFEFKETNTSCNEIDALMKY
jgi:hypothetical protein